ncbi:hypothetical protein PG987_014852 [Apiospora arundinis]
MYLVLWQITYAWSLPFIKCSICLSLFRITNERRYTIPLWCVMVLATFSAMLGFSIIQNISYFISASSILTDWSCAILPCIIVWNLNMKRKLKVSAAGILALGAVASLSTIVRLPYLGAYTAPKDHYYKIANIIIWSEIECGIGIIAGSLPSLRGLIQAYLTRPSTGSSVEQNNHNDGHGNENGNNHHFVTIGGTGGERTAAMGSNLKLGNLNGGGRAEDNNNMILEVAAIAADPVRESSI